MRKKDFENIAEIETFIRGMGYRVCSIKSRTAESILEEPDTFFTIRFTKLPQAQCEEQGGKEQQESYKW